MKATIILVLKKFSGISVEKFNSIEYISLKSKWRRLHSSYMLQEHLFLWIPVLLHELHAEDPRGLEAICHPAQTEMLPPLGLRHSSPSAQDKYATLGEWDAITHHKIQPRICDCSTLSYLLLPWWLMVNTISLSLHYYSRMTITWII